MYKPSDGLFSGVKKQYYDSGSGPRWGGIIGGLIGGIIGFQKYGVNGWIPGALTFMAVVVGTWLGNKAGSLIQSMRAAPPQPTAPITAKGLERAVDGPDSQLGALAAQPTPGKKTDVNKTVTIGQ